MLKFLDTMDPHSLDIWWNGKSIGYLQDHDGPFEVVFVSNVANIRLPVTVLEQILAKKNELVAQKAAKNAN